MTVDSFDDELGFIMGFFFGMFSAAQEQTDAGSMVPYVVGGILGVVLVIGLVLIIKNNFKKSS